MKKRSIKISIAKQVKNAKKNNRLKKKNEKPVAFS